jgi:hypothetical protein
MAAATTAIAYAPEPVAMSSVIAPATGVIQPHRRSRPATAARTPTAIAGHVPERTHCHVCSPRTTPTKTRSRINPTPGRPSGNEEKNRCTQDNVLLCRHAPITGSWYLGDTSGLPRFLPVVEPKSGASLA